MNKRNNSAGLILAAVIAAAAGLAAAYSRRPVKPPDRAGSWQPVESQRTRRQ